MHIMYMEGGQLKQFEGDPKHVPTGVEYWEVTATDKEWMDANRENREAWTWEPDRAADGVGA